MACYPFNTYPEKYEKVAVLAPGPSLRKTYAGQDGFDCVIAINYASYLFPSDWVALWDEFVLRHKKSFGKDGALVQMIPPRRGYIAPKERNPGAEHILMPHMKLKSTFTAPNTLITALSLCRDDGEVHVFGMDMKGTKDCLGHHQETQRDLARWEKEKRQIEFMMADARLVFWKVNEEEV